MVLAALQKVDGTLQKTDVMSVPEARALDADAGNDQRARASRRVWRLTVRGRMLALFLPLLILAGALSVIGIRAVMIARLNQRVTEALDQEIEEVDLLLSSGIDPTTGERFADLERAFNVYFERNVPSVQETHVAFVGDTLLRSRLRTFPVQTLPDDAIAEWAQFSATGAGVTEGTFETGKGSARYRATQVEVNGERGAFVVAILPEVELREIHDLQTYGTLVVSLVVVLAAVSTWTMSDRILAPVRELTETARSISETDRGARVRVGGGGEAVEMAQHFNAMLDRLDAVHYSQIAFLHSVGHELRTPLTVATGHLETIDHDERDRVVTVGLVVSELHRMSRLLDDLQALAEAERDDFVVFADIDLESFARTLLAKSSVMGDRDWQLEHLIGSTFRGDLERLTEAMLNLIDNAVKHTSVGGVIGIGAGISEGEVKLWVRDNGPGIDPADRSDLFEQFVRGHDAERRYRGSGLGLAITRSIAQAHGGDVVIEPSLVGACFCIRFPVEQVL